MQAADPAVEVIDPEEYGRKELMQSGMNRFDVGLEVSRRAFEALGVREALVPWNFPLSLADRLREDGVSCAWTRTPSACAAGSRLPRSWTASAAPRRRPTPRCGSHTASSTSARTG